MFKFTENMLEFSDNKNEFLNMTTYGTSFYDTISYINRHIPFLTVKELTEMGSKLLKEYYGDTVNDWVENWDVFPTYKDSVGKKNWNKLYYDYTSNVLNNYNNTLQDLYKKVASIPIYVNDKKNYALLFYLLKIRDEDPSKLKKMFESDTEGKYLPYSALFKYLPNRKFELPEDIESEPKKKKSDKTKMISDIKSMLSEHKKSKRLRMIKDIDDLIKSVNETKPKMRKSLDKSIKSNDLIHKIEGKLKKKKSIKMSLDKFL
jgi:hypothetical protein